MDALTDYAYIDEIKIQDVQQLTSAEMVGTADSAAGLVGSNALSGAAPHGDGVSNLLKYAFNMNLSGVDLKRLTPGAGTFGLIRFSLRLISLIPRGIGGGVYPV